ncbi:MULTISPECIES: helix-turn-helix domain-containing protein [unclassified Halomonas]|uniref:helix-turn-helix domain-containing protein n=1 Tax=unclassified Halomonas TaxID=2609666 RepID=UPI0020A192F8|nr:MULTISPECIES: helix-turn-helix domain-containing protein [unclassified Halomonas]MCP1312990.1 helix-turn-helix domain-containing protein [Halomonas sp. 707D7]MCP1326163.1 helix-turn-helix domain-containing protein [Halomonas sp. 707D4]
MENVEYGPELLARAGEALYGERWQTALANELGLSDARRVRQWMSRDRGIPVGIWSDVERLLRERGEAAIELADALKSSGV